MYNVLVLRYNIEHAIFLVIIFAFTIFMIQFLIVIHFDVKNKNMQSG